MIGEAYIISQYFLAAVFLLALLHKLSAPARFLAAVENYRLFPSWLLIPVCTVVCLGELVTIALLATYPPAGAAGALALLLAYAAGLAVNLMRGRRYIDCGCSLIGSGKQQEYLSWYMVVRNLCLALMAASLLVPAQTPVTHWMNYGAVVMGVVLFVSLYAVLDKVFAQYFFIRHHAQQSFWQKEKTP